MNDPDRAGPHQPETSDEVAADQPRRIGRYRVEKILGEGGFGRVYLAHDEQLQRPVAVKAPHRRLIRRMCRENPLWGAPRIRAELRLLGHDVAESTVARYMVRRTRPPCANWRSFLANHVDCLASVDFFVVPTVTFRLLYGFLVLRHDRRHVVHFHVTAHPTADWVARQIKDAFPFDETPRYLIRDRDGVYGECFRECLESMGIEEVLTAPQSPWQNPYVERLIGSIRRECLDHLIVFDETHLRRILSRYFDYYHHSRTHRDLDDNAPCPRAIEPPGKGRVVAVPQVGGLHHRYTRAA